MSEYLYLLDTNILSNLIRYPAGNVATKIATAGEHLVCTSIVVACEIRYGGSKKGSAKLFSRIDELLGILPVLPLSEDVDSHYAEIRLYLEKSGDIIGPNDLIIAAHARSMRLTLVTDNVREFLRVPGLKVENWIRE